MRVREPKRNAQVWDCPSELSYTVCTLDDESDCYAAQSLLKLKQSTSDGSISDVESVTNALMSTSSNKGKDGRGIKRKASPTVHDLSQSKGFLKLQPSGKYEVRMEGDDSDTETQKNQSGARTVIVIAKK